MAVRDVAATIFIPRSAQGNEFEDRNEIETACAHFHFLTSKLFVGILQSAETSRRLLCDAGVVPVLQDGAGKTLDVGRKTRSISGALRRALQIRDGGCRFPGCPNRMVDGHHIRHWADGGKTNLENTVLLCRRHHRLLHEGGFAMTGTPDTKLRFFAPSGEPVLPATPAPLLADFGVDPLRTRAISDGTDIQTVTNLPHWDGAHPDYDMALSATLGATLGA